MHMANVHIKTENNMEILRALATVFLYVADVFCISHPLLVREAGSSHA